MMRIMLRAKLHRLTVTQCDINYEGSITLDDALLKAADILPGERVQVVNINNGERFETYTLSGKSGQVCLNGAAARLADPGDRIIVIAYSVVEEKEIKDLKSKVILVDERNRIK